MGLMIKGLNLLLTAGLTATAGNSGATELILSVGDANWSRCSGSACWDQSGDPNHPLPVDYRTRSQTISLGVRAWEIEITANYLGAGRVVSGRFVDDQAFNSSTRRVVNQPQIEVDAEVGQWTAGMRAVWAPRWSLGGGVYAQPELGLYAHRTRWSITWTGEHQARGDGGAWGLTPTGGARILFDAPEGIKVDIGVDLYHRPTVQTAPLGGGARRGPGLIVWSVGVRY
jgi:hypothetical protein